jgi:hypothetical protein
MQKWPNWEGEHAKLGAVLSAFLASLISSSFRSPWISSERFAGSTRMKRRISRLESVIPGCAVISANTARIAGVPGSIFGFFGEDTYRVTVTDLL